MEKAIGPGRPAGRSGGQAPALTTAEVERLLKCTAGSANGVRNVAFLRMLLCGLRVSEPLSIRVRDIRTKDGVVLDQFVLQGANTKNGKTRRVFLTPKTQKAVAAWIESMPSIKGEAPVFDLKPNYATTLVKRLMSDAGLSHASSHSLRRSAAHQLQDKGISIPHISQVLGHSSVAVTSHYLDKSPANVAKAIQALDW